MTQIMTKKEAVEKFGSESCKKHFQKYGKFKNTSIEQSLVKTLQQHYEIVETAKEGRSFVYVLEGQRTSPKVRKDKRCANGEMKEITRNINIVVASYLDMYGSDGIQRTLLSWLHEFGLINSQQLKVFQYGYDKKVRAMIFAELIENEIIENNQSQLVSDYSCYLNGFKAKLGECLKRLEKFGSIELIEHHVGVYAKYKSRENNHKKDNANEESKEENREAERTLLDSLTYFELEKAKTAIRDSNKLSYFTIMTYPNSAKVRKYHEEVDALYSTYVIEKNKETFTLEYYYKSYEIVLINQGEILQNYLERIEAEEDLVLSFNDIDFFNSTHMSKFHNNLNKDAEEFSLKKEMSNCDYFKEKTEIKRVKEITEMLEIGLVTEEQLCELQEQNIEKFYHYASKYYYDYSLEGKYHKKIMEIHNYYFKTKDESSEVFSAYEDVKFSWIFESRIIPSPYS